MLWTDRQTDRQTSRQTDELEHPTMSIDRVIKLSKLRAGFLGWLRNGYCNFYNQISIELLHSPLTSPEINYTSVRAVDLIEYRSFTNIG